MNEGVLISVKLCGRTYRIKVASENEATVRSTVQVITDKVNDLKKNFPGRDDHDYMAMTLLDFVTASKDNTTKTDTSSEKVIEQLNALIKLIDE